MIIKRLAIAALFLGASSAQAVPIQWATGSGANGNWYEFISNPVDWAAARASALASTWQGQQGYLATVTSAGENAFIATVVTQGLTAWLGGSDEWNRNSDNADEGKWKWMDGPEAGQMFWNAGLMQGYSNWNPGEPNNCCSGEDYLQINWGSVGGWNDHGAPGNPGQRNGYVVEYAGIMPASIPEPGSLALAAAALAGLGVIRRRN